jgi:hypothetical protein
MNKHSIVTAVLVAACLAGSMHVHAWVAAGRDDAYRGGVYYHDGGYYHGNGYYYDNGWASHGVVIGVPAGAYYGTGCSLIQRCYPNAGCVNERICN